MSGVDSTDRNGPLAGIRVLDMSRVLAGPWAGQLLADFGASAIKIERPGTGDDTRLWGPPWVGDSKGSARGDAAYFMAANRNKRSMTLELSHPDGQAIAREMAAAADVLIENFRVGTMQRFGLDYDTLAAANPGLVYCSISAYGQTSSRAAEPGYDAMMQASAGLMSVTGPPDSAGGGPQKVGVAISDIMTGMYAASAILAALTARAASGRGQHIDLALYDSQVAWLANQNMNYLVGNFVPQRQGTAHPNIVPYQVFATADGHLMLAVGNEAQFAACADVLGLPEVASDPRFATNAARLDHRSELIGLLAGSFLRRDTRHWLDALRARGVPAGPISDIGEVFSDPYAKERQLVHRLPHPFAGEVPTVANPVRFSETPVEYRCAPPMLGQHTDEILADELQYSPEKIAALRRDGAI